MNSLKNISASVKEKLLNKSRLNNRSFNELLQHYAMERFLYRLSQSKYAKHYILKGALMLKAWDLPELRPTMDIDMLAKTQNKSENIILQIQDILNIKVEPDGLSFDASSIKTEKITEDAEYEGIRVRFCTNLGNAKTNMQIDIGFGDIIYPKPNKLRFPCILNLPAPYLLCYSKESIISEKFEAMIKLGELNSRMKDFYDIWFLSRQFEFELKILNKAIRQTFKKRGTQLIEPIDAFSSDFISSHQSMWIAFCKRLKQNHVPKSLRKIITDIEIFLKPVIKGVSDNLYWKITGQWSN